MSGIYGRVGASQVNVEELRAMAGALAHRGRDDEGRHTRGAAGLGCRRLAVIDHAAGVQPLSNELGTVWAVHDGAIYNHRSLRKDLENKGHRFRTRSDAEVIVHLYEEFGERCVERLRGMFSLALWDEERERLLLARDRLGQKPLFYTLSDGDLLFASEVKALIAARPRLREVDYTAVHHYLSMRFVPAPRTMLRDVLKLPPGHVLVYGKGECRVSRYWEPSFRSKLELPERELFDLARAKLRETVSAHLAAEVPVGAFLSGGLDSSLIVAMAVKSVGKGFPTFSVGVAHDEFNELPFAREVARRFGAQQHETWAEHDLLGILPTVIWHLDEPSDPVAATKYVGAQLASQHVKVVLGGDGGDELFAGFDRYRGVRLASYYAWLPRWVRHGPIERLIQRLPVSFGYGSLVKKLRWFQRVASVDGTAERFAEGIFFFRFSHAQKQELWSGDIWEEVKDRQSSELIVEQVERSDAADPMERMLHADYVMRLPEHSLMLTDRLGMAHGVEIRSPLVDHELVECLASFPVNMKVRGREAKYIERRIADTELPRRVARRGKRGFRLPLASWLGEQLHPTLQRMFDESELIRDGIFRRSAVERLLEEHRTRRADHDVRLWMLVNLELWYRVVARGQAAPDVGEWVKKDLCRTTADVGARAC